MLRAHRPEANRTTRFILDVARFFWRIYEINTNLSIIPQDQLINFIDTLVLKIKASQAKNTYFLAIKYDPGFPCLSRRSEMRA
jgi:hypothetical protein